MEAIPRDVPEPGGDGVGPGADAGAAAEDPVAVRLREVAAGIARGWAFTPLDGKVPILKRWQSQPKATLEEALDWTRERNVGLRTGAISGVVVVDFDGRARPDDQYPPTVTVVTGGGGRHLYYQVPDGVRVPNSVRKLGPGIDVRGDRGQVVFVGSVHPVTGRTYQWAQGRSPAETALAPLPAWILEALQAGVGPPPVAPPPPVDRRARAYGLKALRAELQKVKAVAEGQRNMQLNGSAFKLGRLIGGGCLDRATVEHELLAATALPEAEARATILSGIEAGAQQPRRPAAGRRSVLIPGAHHTDAGTYQEVSEKDFAQAALLAIPEGSLYRRGEPALAGQLLGRQGSRYFSPLDLDAARLLIGEHARLSRGVASTKGGDPKQVLCGVSRGNAGLVLAEARTNDRVRRIDLIAPYPAYGCSPGWNANGIFYDAVPELTGLEPELDAKTIHCALEDLLVDFPFADDASRENFIGLLLTALLRPAIDGNVPLHLVASPLERTGKTKLCEEVLGGVLLGYPTPALQLAGSEEEIDKRIVGLLLKAVPLVHLDNLRTYVDSPSLASLITASLYQGRILGGNGMPTLSNRMVLVASGNNVRMSGEMAKRTVPISLQPSDEAPELRDDFQHPDLRAFVQKSRRLLLACLLGMIARWEQQGRPKGTARLGGFEAWARVVGGVMRANGYTEWFTNAREWQRQADPHGEDLASFVELWAERHGTTPVTASRLMALAEENDLFLDELRGSTEKGKLGSFCKRVLGRHKDRPVRGSMIRQVRNAAERLWALQPAGGDDTS